jgi:hypothetical protein
MFNSRLLTKPRLLWKTCLALKLLAVQSVLTLLLHEHQEMVNVVVASVEVVAVAVEAVADLEIVAVVEVAEEAEAGLVIVVVEEEVEEDPSTVVVSVISLARKPPSKLNQLVRLWLTWTI